MPVMRTYQCPDCDGYFDHMHMRSVDEPPAFCPLCGANTSSASPELSAPHIAKTIGKVADNVYRQMETGSAARAEMAAELLGESASDMGMKITDMRDDNHEGEISAARAPNPVSTFMAQTGVGGMTDAAVGAQYASSVNSGPFARAGDRARQDVAAGHQVRARQGAAAGNMGVHRGG